ncbi:MAG: hypothetical protein Q7R45_10970, partial [Sulfuricaulis sp.]|nr:hypothetical protein [Sulfuricaulis sp.]
MFTVRADEHGISFMPSSGASEPNPAAAPAFKARPNEPAYALLQPSNGAQVNQWGKSIQLVKDDDKL